MKQKVLVMMAMLVLLANLVYAGDFKIQYPAGTDIFVVDTSGNLNVTSGTIAENGQLLSDLYCALTGCTATGISVATINVTTLLNVSGGSVDFAADSIPEGDVAFATSCGSGNHLYINGNDLACEANTDTNASTACAASEFLEGDGSCTDVIEESELDDLSELNTQITDATLKGTGTLTDTKYCTWDATSDTINCTSTGSSGGNTTEEMQDATLQHINGLEGITYTYDDTGNQGNISFDCSEVTDSANDHLGCSDENLAVDDDFVLNAGDTMTGDLVMNANINLSTGKVIQGGGSSNITIDGTGNVIIVLG